MSQLLRRRGIISQSTDIIIPPPVGGLTIAPPVGPFTLFDGNFGSQSHPSCFVRTDQATTIQKYQCQEYTGWGIGSMQYYPPANNNPGRSLIEDCIAQNIYSSPPKVMDGTGESCFWFGNPTTARRFVAANGAWMGMWTGSKSFGSLFEDFRITGPYVGLYVEHETNNSTFRRFSINTGGNGINIEWWYGGAGSHSLLFEDGEIYCPNSSNLDYRSAGIFADAGTYNCTFRRIRFWGPGNGIGLPNHRAVNIPNVVEDCVFENAGAHIYYHDN